MRRTFSISALALAAMAACPAPTLAAEKTPTAATALKPAPLSALVKSVDIPCQRFTLPNGLRVLVHTDRKAPVVALSVWYGVGSKHEPKGKTGFAHLFEHLMFNGSEHSPGDFFEPLQEIGATDTNGTTWFDRTNYFETVPTGALDLALMLESDRMGYLLGAITKEKLDNQRAVVQNEKRQGDNQPFGMVEYEEYENLYPSGHPYHHSTIGSMADLDSASLDDVKGWFRDHYAPNNAILVLAGDIDLPTARTKVASWFGPIPAGPAVVPVAVPVTTLPAPLAKTIKDQVATTRIYRMWAIPGLDSPDNLPMELSGLVLGGLASSRLDDALVRKQQVAVAVSASADIFAQGGQFVVYADVKPGQDAATVARALDAVIADYRAKGPTSDELTRAATTYAGSQIRALESVGGMNGKAPTLAEGLLYSNDPAYYRAALEKVSTLTPAQVRTVTAKWLARPAFALTVEPGTRTEGGEGRAGFVTGGADGGTARPAFYHDPLLATPAAAAAKSFADPDRSKLPAVGTLASLTFPTIEHATLSNGIKVYLARRPAVPVVSVRVAFDAGYAADPATARGTQSLLLRLMNEGTRSLDSSALAKARERLGADIRGASNADTTWFQLEALTPNLPSSLALLSEYVRHPALTPPELERVRAQQLASISAELNEPRAIAQRVLMPVLYGSGHPYAAAASGAGDPTVVRSLTTTDLSAFHRRWFRPDKASIFVVGDTTLPALTHLLEVSFGDWKAPTEPGPVKDFAAPVPAQTARIILVDRPASPQSMIYAGEVLDAKGTDDLLALKSANDVFGGNFLSRMNTNLRETKGWSYGVASGVSDPIERASFRMMAPVQADRTGDSIAEIRKDLTAFLGPKGITPVELQWTTNGSARELPGSFETNGSVLEAVMKIARYKRPENFYETLAARYRAMTTAQLDTAARTTINPDKIVYVVVGDSTKVRPQLEALGLPIEVATVKGK
jgi:predicted Zn-dependent peptidase